MSDLQGVLAAKYQLLNRGGTLTYEPDTAKFADVGGMQNLRSWLTNRKPAFNGSAPELDPPKGGAVLGRPGLRQEPGGARLGGDLRRAVLRLDFGALYSKWHRRIGKESARITHKRRSPCAVRVWTTESKKRSPMRGDSGTSRRVLGTFLTWLAEQRRGYSSSHRQ